MFTVELPTPPTAHLTVFLHIQFPLIAQEVVWGFSPSLPLAVDVPCPILLPLTRNLPACSEAPWYPEARLTACSLFALPHPCACPAPWMKAELCRMPGVLLTRVMQRGSNPTAQGERRLSSRHLLQDDAAAPFCGSRDSRCATHSAQEGGKGRSVGSLPARGSPVLPTGSQVVASCCSDSSG